MVANKKIVFKLAALLFLQTIVFQGLYAQATPIPSYTNPIIHEDFSDPDVIRVDGWFYMTASSFTSVPGLPILRSADLVQWELIGYALKTLIPKDYYSKVQHGAGVWAPSIRYHNGEFYIYYPDPDFGIYMIKSKNIMGPWTEPILVLGGKGLIDPCPLWDDNGKVYLVHAYAGSRAGIKSVLAMKELNAAGTQVIDDGKLIYDGHGIDPTVEGPKLYKRNGWYYVFAPAGGVSTGWQIVLRSKNIYGPYERKKVLEQGASNVNGPHQGAWVQTETGEDWFIHFQDKAAYGRITHLQPMVWKNDWPMIGEDANADEIGTPIQTYIVKGKIISKEKYDSLWRKTTDDYNKAYLKKQKKTSASQNLPVANTLVEANPFQWNANPSPNWRLPYQDSFRHYAVLQADSALNLWNFPALYLRKLPAEQFTATTHINFNSFQKGERAGFILFGKSYASIELKHTELGLVINYVECIGADKGIKELVKPIVALACINNSTDIYFRIQMEANGLASFAYSLDGTYFTKLENKFTAAPGIWVGAKMGYYCVSERSTNDAGYLEINNIVIKNN